MRSIMQMWARGEKQAISDGLVNRIVLQFDDDLVCWYRDWERAQCEFPEDLSDYPPSIPHRVRPNPRYPFRRSDRTQPPAVPHPEIRE